MPVASCPTPQTSPTGIEGLQVCGQDSEGRQPERFAGPAATRFGLVVNLKTAAALGITIPPTMLLRADELIK